MDEADHLVEVKLVLTRKLADQLRQGVTHHGPVTLRLHDNDTLTVKFPAIRCEVHNGSPCADCGAVRADGVLVAPIYPYGGAFGYGPPAPRAGADNG